MKNYLLLCLFLLLLFLPLIAACSPASTENEVYVQKFQSQITVTKINGKIKSVTVYLPDDRAIYNLEDLAALQTQIQSLKDDLDYIENQMIIDKNFNVENNKEENNVFKK